jgi:hypothetical protein
LSPDEFERLVKSGEEFMLDEPYGPSPRNMMKSPSPRGTKEKK